MKNQFAPDESILFEQFGKGKETVSTRTNNVVIYTRVSTKEQADNNMSLDTQKKMCEQFAQKNGYSVTGIFGGTYESAQTDERKEFNRMLTYVKKCHEKVSYIIVYSVDRFSRSGANAIYITEQLKRQGVTVLSVTQPTDTTTSSGSLQQNIQFIFSEYDNQLRREKCMSGVKEALLRGEWCHKAPFGYDEIKINGKRQIVVNEQGKILRKAFLWKANVGISNEETVSRLKALGLNLSNQRVSEILMNTFYCGLMAHKALQGKLAEGTHEKLISKEIFLKVNGVQKLNPHGHKQQPENENVPLKVFVKCGHCGTSLSGYIVTKKKIWYYKCRKKECCNNKSANQLHEAFGNILSQMKMDEKHQKLVKLQMVKTYNKMNAENVANTAQLKGQFQEISTKLERLEERFILEEIAQELFTKYRDKFKKEQVEIMQNLQKVTGKASNLEECIHSALDYALNLRTVWEHSDYNKKQRLQYLVFPEGIRYSKKDDAVLTNRINSVFLAIAQQSQELGQTKNGIPGLKMDYAALVVPGRTGLCHESPAVVSFQNL